MLSKRFTTQAASVTKTSVELTRGAGKAEPMGIAGWSEVFQGSVDAGSRVPGVPRTACGGGETPGIVAHDHQSGTRKHRGFALSRHVSRPTRDEKEAGRNWSGLNSCHRS